MSIFKSIINGTLPAYIIAEDEYFMAFLDVAPVREGHTLVIPKIEVDKFFDQSDFILQQYLLFAKPIAKAIENTFHCNRCGIAVVGLEVPHAHMHLIPINSLSDMDFSQPRLPLSAPEFADIQERIKSRL